MKRIHLLLGALLTTMLGVSWHLHEADHTCPIGIVWLIGLTAAFTITIAEYADRRR